MANPHTAPIGILGGTFDPVHNAHLAIARRALEALALERVLWMPTGAPGYRAAPVAGGDQRLAMLRLALGDAPRHAIDARELATGASGYTVDTLEALRAELGQAVALVLLIGADQYAALPTWHRWTRLFALAHVAVFGRPGHAAEPPAAQATSLAARVEPLEGAWRERAAGAVLHVPMTPLAISGSELRRRVAAGRPIADAVPAAVAAYIDAERLYRAAPGAP